MLFHHDPLHSDGMLDELREDAERALGRGRRRCRQPRHGHRGRRARRIGDGGRLRCRRRPPAADGRAGPKLDLGVYGCRRTRARRGGRRRRRRGPALRPRRGASRRAPRGGRRRRAGLGARGVRLLLDLAAQPRLDRRSSASRSPRAAAPRPPGEASPPPRACAARGSRGCARRPPPRRALGGLRRLALDRFHLRLDPRLLLIAHPALGVAGRALDECIEALLGDRSSFSSSARRRSASSTLRSASSAARASASAFAASAAGRPFSRARSVSLVDLLARLRARLLGEPLRAFLGLVLRVRREPAELLLGLGAELLARLENPLLRPPPRPSRSPRRRAPRRGDRRVRSDSASAIALAAAVA